MAEFCRNTYRGSYCNINAILNGETEYGVTLHYIEAGVDDGDIIDISTVPIEKNTTGFDLYLESERLCYELITNNINRLLGGKNARTPQQVYIDNGHLCNTYKCNKTICLIDLTHVDFNDSLCLRTVRAFDSPNHEPAFIQKEGERVYVRYRYGNYGIYNPNSVH